MRFPTGKTTLSKAKGTQRDTKGHGADPRPVRRAADELGTVASPNSYPASMRQSLAVDLGTVAE